MLCYRNGNGYFLWAAGGYSYSDRIPNDVRGPYMAPPVAVKRWEKRARKNYGEGVYHFVLYRGLRPDGKTEEILLVEYHWTPVWEYSWYEYWEKFWPVSGLPEDAVEIDDSDEVYFILPDGSASKSIRMKTTNGIVTISAKQIMNVVQSIW